MKVIVNQADAYVKDPITLTSGRAGATIDFEFSQEWAGLGKTAVFTAGNTTKYVVLSTNSCIIPSEVLTTANQIVIVGIYGTNGTDIIIPTVYCALGLVETGTNVTGTEPGEITQTLYNQVSALLTNAQTELTTIKQTAVKQVATNSVNANSTGTASVSLELDWINASDHNEGKKATFVFSNLKGIQGPEGPRGNTGATGVGINAVTFSNDILTINRTDGNSTTYDGFKLAKDDFNIFANQAQANETNREANEVNRTVAESNRANAETIRINNESNRVNAESNRVNIETNRVNAENIRVNNENNRASAESNRVNAENIRVNNENTRLANEIRTVHANIDSNIGTPEVTVNKSGNDLSFYFKNLKGQKGDTGSQGETGPRGNDGFNPTTSITSIEGGHRFSVTDVNGTNSCDIMDGNTPYPNWSENDPTNPQYIQNRTHYSAPAPALTPQGMAQLAPMSNATGVAKTMAYATIPNVLGIGNLCDATVTYQVNGVTKSVEFKGTILQTGITIEDYFENVSASLTEHSSWEDEKYVKIFFDNFISGTDPRTVSEVIPNNMFISFYSEDNDSSLVYCLGLIDDAEITSNMYGNVIFNIRQLKDKDDDFDPQWLDYEGGTNYECWYDRWLSDTKFPAKQLGETNHFYTWLGNDYFVRGEEYDVSYNYETLIEGEIQGIASHDMTMEEYVQYITSFEGDLPDNMKAFSITCEYMGQVYLQFACAIPVGQNNLDVNYSYLENDITYYPLDERYMPTSIPKAYKELSEISDDWSEDKEIIPTNLLKDFMCNRLFTYSSPLANNTLDATQSTIARKWLKLNLADAGIEGFVKVNKSVGGIELNKNSSASDYGILKIYPASTAQIQYRENTLRPIIPNMVNYAVKAALTDANRISLTATEKTNAQSVFGYQFQLTAGNNITIENNVISANGGGGTVTDVQVNGVSVLTNGVANIPRADRDNMGVIKMNGDFGLSPYGATGIIATEPAIENEIDSRTTAGNRQIRKPITPYRLNYAVTAVLTDANKITLNDAQKANAQSVFDYQFKLTAGDNITINGNVISATGGGGSGGDMYKAVYDTHNRNTDIFDYVDNKTAVSDVRINGVSIVINGIADIPIYDGSIT